MDPISEIEVRIDIAGMYYGRNVVVPRGSTILQAMTAARDLDVADVANGGTNPQLTFWTETFADGSLGIDGITVEHLVPAKSRQKSNGLEHPAREYPIGRYEYFDDSVLVGPNGEFSPKDQTKNFVLAWQYYIYDKEGRDRDRAGLNGVRKVIPFSKQHLEEDCLIVWRLVAIFMRPYGESLKVASSRQRSEAKAA